MSNTRKLKSRIDSVQNTKKVTKAMQMISTSKMQKAQKLATEANPYAQNLSKVLSKLTISPEYESIYLRKKQLIKNIGLVVIGQSRGFVGGQTNNLLFFLENELKQLKQNYENATFKGISIHKLGLKIVNSLKINSLLHFSQFFENPNTTNLEAVVQSIFELFKDDKLDLVYICFMNFISILKHEPKLVQLLPVPVKVSTKKNNDSKFLFEPSEEKILDFLLPEYYETQILRSVINSNASEHSGRMIAMKNATDNASDLIKDLKLEFNKTRQTQITQEILDVAIAASYHT